MSLSETRKRKLSALFRVLDVDSNGSMERADHEAIVRNLAMLRGWRPGGEDYTKLFTKLIRMWEHIGHVADKDKDGSVSLDEWLEYHDKLLDNPDDYREIVVDEVRLILQLVDLDQDGRLSKLEYKLFFDIYGIEAMRLPEIFAQLDIDGDGYITHDELWLHLEDFYFSDDPEARGNWIFGPF